MYDPMPEQILEKLFESPAKIKILKLFLRNSTESFSFATIQQRLKLDQQSCKTQLANLTSIKLLTIRVKQKEKQYSLNHKFEFLDELQNLVLKSSPASKNKILNSIKKLGKIHLLLLAGVFINSNSRGRYDILVVGDNVNEKRLKEIVRNIEAEAGTQIRYSLMDMGEFKYRRDMFDKFIREVLDGPYEKLVDKIGLAK